MASVVLVVSLITFLHHVAAQMRGPVIPLHAVAHGATAAGVGVIVSAHMLVAAAGSIPLGRASDAWGRRPLLLAGIAMSAITSLLLAMVDDQVWLAAVYGLAGLGVAAFTPSALSLVGDAAAPGRAGQAYAWYSTAHYGAIGVGPFVGGLVAEWSGYRGAFLWSAATTVVALVVAVALPMSVPPRSTGQSHASFAEIRRDATVWGGWVVAASGMLLQGVVFTFFPLLGLERELSASAIGLVFLVLGVVNTAARFPAGWLVDRSGRPASCAIGGVLLTAMLTAVLPHAGGQVGLLFVVTAIGAATGIVGVATGVALSSAGPPAARGVVMGGYSTALYLGLAAGSLALGPVIAGHGLRVGFVTGGVAGAIGALLAALLWSTDRRRAGYADSAASAVPSRAASTRLPVR
jgi:predicted MFS family arabinose efflux permease